MLTKFEVPTWVIFAAYGAIGAGTMSGGWRIVRTMGARLTKLKPRSGFCAETAAAGTIMFATEYLALACLDDPGDRRGPSRASDPFNV